MAALNVPMSSREDTARQMRSSRHPYLHHWLRGSSEHQWPRTVACLRKIGSLSSRLDACALISSHGAAMRAACRTQCGRDEKARRLASTQRRFSNILGHQYFTVVLDIAPYAYIAPPIGVPTIVSSSNHRLVLATDLTSSPPPPMHAHAHTILVHRHLVFISCTKNNILLDDLTSFRHLPRTSLFIAQTCIQTTGHKMAAFHLKMKLPTVPPSAPSRRT